MRTLLNESIPPFQTEDKPFSLPAPAGPGLRTVSENAVLAKVNSFSEVGVDGTAMSTPSGSRAEQANAPLGRGMAASQFSKHGSSLAGHASPKLKEPKQAMPGV